MTSFYEEALSTHEDRKINEFHAANKKEANRDAIYYRYCAWCNANEKQSAKKDPYAFRDYLISHNITLGFWDRKVIAERHFGYQYTWNGNDWDIRRIK